MNRSDTWLRTAITTVGLLAAAAPGCSTPEITHKQTRVGDITENRMRLVFDLEVFNPGRRTYVLTDSQFRLKMAAQQYVRGRRDEYLLLYPGQRVAWAVPIDVDVSQVFQLIQGIDRGTRVPFELDLDCGYRTHPGVGRWSVWFNTTGQLPLPAMPTLHVDRVIVTRLTDEQAAVIAEVVVANGNDEPLTLASMQYQLKLAGHEMSTGILTERRTIPANGSVRVRVGGSSVIMGAEFGLGRRLTQSHIAYTFQGRAQVETPLRLPWSFAVSRTAPVIHGPRR